MNAGLFPITLDMFTYECCTPHSIYHKRKTTTTKSWNKQTNTLYNTQCSSSSCGVVLLAGRCFWQVNGSSRSTGGWRILGEVHSFTKEVTKAGTIHFTVQLQGMGVTVFNLHLVKFTVSFPKRNKNPLHNSPPCFLHLHKEISGAQSAPSFPHVLFRHVLCTVGATRQQKQNSPFTVKQHKKNIH